MADLTLIADALAIFKVVVTTFDSADELGEIDQGSASSFRTFTEEERLQQAPALFVPRIQ